MSEPRRPLADVLQRIVAQRKRRILEADVTRVAAPVHEAVEPLTREEQPFLGALAARRGEAIIAEVKMGSPRIGSLVDKVDPEVQARLYRDHGAAALSVVVEPDFFFGSYELLARCKEASGLPAIAKDFIVDPIQIRWARQAGADAVLLIAALYSAERLLELARIARRFGLVPLVELHDEEELELLAGPAAPPAEDHGRFELVGINHRDLRTFEVDLDHSRPLLPRLPQGALRVAESGIANGAQRRHLAAAGFDAFLIGESLLLAPDPAAQLRELLS
ncbi:MAG: indole-3-glycerol phosphate synthase TrpC [Acidobacteriota bacterium]